MVAALIHNLHLIGRCCCRYDNFDCEEAACMLQPAFAEHDANPDAYGATACAVLAVIEPESKANVCADDEAVTVVCTSEERAR